MSVSTAVATSMFRRTNGPADPCAMVIFGATGDLTKRKLVPALLNLLREGRLSDSFALVTVARAQQDEASFRERVISDLEEFANAGLDDRAREWFASRIMYVQGEFEDPDTYRRLGEALRRADEGLRTSGNCLFYLATPPSLFEPTARALGEAGLTREDGGWRRVIVEKPFGRNLESARALNRALAQVFAESQIYRIDHYLGKETVQNIMAFRFANGIFEPIWNRRYVDHVQITVAETDGVGSRGGYYDQAGALRDMVQNHLFQLLALVAMEPPNSFAADAVRDERVKVLLAIRPFEPRDVARYAVRGQYAAGEVNGEHVPAYREEAKVAPGTMTETFVALRLALDTWRWADVPFYLRTGKRLPTRVSEIAIQFKCPPLSMFRQTACEVQPNLLILRIQPDEGIALRFQAKQPGPGLELGTVRMDFKYADYFGTKPSTGYETLLFDCMTGDPTLFHRADIVEAGWAAVDPILEAWEAGAAPRPAPYAPGTWGPEAADELLARDGRTWRRPGQGS